MIDKNMKYNEAKTFFYSILDGLLDELNRNDSIREFFYHYPVGYQDVRFTVSFDYEDKGYLEKDDVYMISILDNSITYFLLKEDGVQNKLASKEIYPGMGTLSFTGLDALRTIERDLPEPPETEAQ
jgi:hypothetical protein